MFTKDISGNVSEECCKIVEDRIKTITNGLSTFTKRFEAAMKEANDATSTAEDNCKGIVDTTACTVHLKSLSKKCDYTGHPINWDKESENISNQLRKKFGN